jgi:hypothetical protein
MGKMMPSNQFTDLWSTILFLRQLMPTMQGPRIDEV